MKNFSTTILVVEDNEDDVFAMKRALKKAQVENPLQIVADGQEALDYLAGAGPYSDRGAYPLPFMVFLDLKLPYVSGFEVLSRIRQQSALADLVVIVLTSSDEAKDHQRAYDLGARSYLVKPPDAAELRRVINTLSIFWSRFAENGPILAQNQDP